MGRRWPPTTRIYGACGRRRNNATPLGPHVYTRGTRGAEGGCLAGPPVRVAAGGVGAPRAPGDPPTWAVRG